MTIDPPVFQNYTLPPEFRERMSDGGNFIRVLREARGITLEIIAARSGIALDRLTALDNGNDLPEADEVEAICRGLGINFGDVEGTED